MSDDIKYLDAKYSEHYSDDDLWDKIKNGFKSAGLVLIYKALQLYYVMKKPDCPVHIKAAIVAALGYFILPIDLVPDFIPVVGYSDDLAAVGAALIMAQAYVDEDIEKKAKETIDSIFGAGTSYELD